MPNHFCIIKKLSGLRKKLREWNLNTYGILENNIKLTKSRIKTIENKGESRSLTDVECVESSV